MSNSKAAMSSTSSPKRYELRLPADPDAAVTVYDAGDEVVWAGPGGSTIVLPRGLYTVRVELNLQVAERPVRLVKATDLSQLTPRRYTAAPLSGTAMSHEYYSYTSQDLSRKETRKPLAGATAPDAGLFIFLRAVDLKHASQLSRALGQGLELRDMNDMVVSRLDPSECVVNTTQGWLAFSAQAPHGYYRLVDLGDHPREMALHVFPQWQTQIFVLWTDRPVLEGARIFVQRPGCGFRFEDETEQAADLALDALATGARRVPRRALNVLWISKFENPMLGLIGAYTELQRLRRLSGAEWQAAAGDIDTRQLLDMVIGNLGGLVPDSPDVHALEVFAAEVFERPAPPRTFLQPPMFRVGFDAVVRTAAARPDLVPASGIVDDIATVLFTDSVWTTWRPLQFTRAAPILVAPRIMDVRVAGLGDDFASAKAEDVKFGKPFEPNWVQSGFLTALQTEQARLRRAREQKVQPRVAAAVLAAQLRVTPRMIEKAVAEMDALGADGIKALIESDWNSLASTINPEHPKPFSRFIVADFKASLGVGQYVDPPMRPLDG